MRLQLSVASFILSLAPSSLLSRGGPWTDGSGITQSATKATEDAYGDPSYTAPPANISTPLDQLPDARPPIHKRRFVSRMVEAEVARLSQKIKDPALRQIFSNVYPNTLDTTIAWTNLQLDEPDHAKAFPRAMAITGDIEAMWLRDSFRQVDPYLDLLLHPPSGFAVGDEDWTKLYRLALGLVYMQAQYVITDPFANAFGPPESASMIRHKKNPAMGKSDTADWIYPPPPGSKSHYDPQPNSTQSEVHGTDGAYVWEQKWEVDSLASFFALSGRVAKVSNRTDFIDNKTWRRAAGLAICTLRSQQRSTAEEHISVEKADGSHAAVAILPLRHSNRSIAATSFDYTAEWNRRFAPLGEGVYRFQRLDRSATETRADHGFGEPGRRTGMVKSAFRPSDDATLLPFLVPSNAALAVALESVVPLMRRAKKRELDALADDAEGLASGRVGQGSEMVVLCSH
ncbi:hypothetical protein V8E36_005290, partial [Tilletia maclaganii]